MLSNRQACFGLGKHWLFTNDIFMQQLFGCKFPFVFFLIFTKKQESLEQLIKEKKNIVEAMPSRSEASSALMGFN